MKRFLFLCFLLTGLAFSQEKSPRLTLLECLRLAEENNLQLRQASLAVRAATCTREEAFTKFLPQLSSSATYTYLGRPPEISLPGLPGSFQLTKAGLSSLSLTLAQPVFTGGLLSASYQQAVENVKATSYQYQSVKQNVFLEVEKAYWGILKAQRAVEVTRELRKQAEEHRRVASSLFEQGLATKLDLLKTDVFLAEVARAIVEADNAVRLARASLGYLLHQELAPQLEFEDILEQEGTGLSLEAWQQLARENRPELASVRAARRVAEQAVTVARSGYFPQVALAWSFTEEKGTQSAPSHWRGSWNLVAAVNLNIWDWQATRNRVERARTQLVQAETACQQLLSTIELEVKTAYLNCQSARERIRVSRAALTEAEENLRLTNLAYREGIATTTEVLDAQVALSQARHSYCQAWYDYQVASAQLRYSAGGSPDLKPSPHRQE